MFSERLTNLINASIVDGVITEEEKAAIHKRAVAEGEEIEEVDIYIQSLLQARQQEADSQAKLAKKERDRNIRRCPRCGAVVSSISNICPECGQAIISSDATTSIQDMIQYLDSAFETLSWDKYHYYWREGVVEGSPDFLNNLYEKGYIDKIKHLEKRKLNNLNQSRTIYYGSYQYFPIKNKLRILYGEDPSVKTYLEEQHYKECFIKLVEAVGALNGSDSKEDLDAIQREISFHYSDLDTASVLSVIKKKKGFLWRLLHK